jgi:hypothetical protein
VPFVVTPVVYGAAAFGRLPSFLAENAKTFPALVPLD